MYSEMIKYLITGAHELSSYEKDSVKIADRAEQMLSVPSVSNTDFWVVSKVTVKQTSCSPLKSTQRSDIDLVKTCYQKCGVDLLKNATQI